MKPFKANCYHCGKKIIRQQKHHNPKWSCQDCKDKRKRENSRRLSKLKNGNN